MKLLYRCCAGLDIHRDTVSACIRRRVRGRAEALIEEEYSERSHKSWSVCVPG